MENTLLKTIGKDIEPSAEAIAFKCSLDMLTAVVIGRLISERLLDYGGQPGEAIEYAAAAVSDALLETIPLIDFVELKRLMALKGRPNAY